MRHEGPREREYYPGPFKKQRMDYNYQEPERRPIPKYVQRAPEPTPAPAVIEKRPVLFNESNKNVSEYPPLPQRKPVQRPKVVPQPQPTKPIEKPPTKPVEKLPVQPVQTSMKPAEKQQIKPVEKPTMKAVVEKQAVPPNKLTPPKQPTKPVQTTPVQKQAVPPNKATPPKQPTKPVQTTPVEKQAVPPNKATPPKQPTKPVQTTPVQNQAVPPNKATPPKQPTNPLQTTPVLKLAPQVVQKNQDVKPRVNNKLQAIKKEEDPPLGPCPEGYSQLSDLMSRALGEELRHIMDLVAKELPTQAPTPAERFVIKQFRTVVGDDIKKALGLNVTKRLLNVHNPLYVKLLFSGKPEAGRLQAFIKQYNISAFKRLEAPGDLFAARLDTVADFDCLCAAGEVSCGSAKVTVTPCYKYLACPPMLHTIYGTYTEPEKSEKKPEDTVKSVEADTSTEGEKIKQEISPVEGDTLAIKQEVKNEPSENITIKQEVADANDTDANAKNSSIKINITIEAAPKSEANKTINEKEIPIETVIDELSKEIDKPIKEEKNIKIENIDEEMNDSDIISLMSGGIVLDECSGSDDEK